MKAVVIDAPNEIDYREVKTPEPGPDDVLIKSHKAGVCRTDLEILRGELPAQWVRYPCIPGHEWSGTVAAAGRNVNDLSTGDRVVSEGMIPCGLCRRCKVGATNLCENYDQLGFTRGGGYGEFVLAPRHVVHRLPDHVPLDAAVLIEPAACVYRALERAAPEPGEVVGVVGVGSLGSIAVLLARLFSPGAVVAFGLRDEELEFARLLGADHAINVTTEDPEAETLRLTRDGIDVVIETAGSPPAVAMANRVVRTGGRVGLLGIAGAHRKLDMPADQFVIKDSVVVGTMSYTTAVWTKVLRLLESDLIDLSSIITHRFPAAEFTHAMTLMDRRQGTVAKIILEHDEQTAAR